MIMETLVQEHCTFQHIFTRTQEAMPACDIAPENISLHDLVDQLMNELLPAAVNRKSFILNDIQHKLLVNTDKCTLTQVLENLIHEVVKNSAGGCVRVEAAAAGNMTLIHVKDRCASFNNNMACSLQQVKPLVKKLGGSICISSNPAQGMIVAFTLYNQQLAA